jgi:heme/copper-type cytochrome/quinol oxidase subunit 2
VVTVVPRRPSRGRLLLLCLTSLFFAVFRPATDGAGLAPPPDQPEDVVVSRSGFVPSVIHARKGEAIHFRLTSRDQEHCFAIDAFRVEKRVVPGRTTAVDVTPDRAGTFPYYCCLESGAAAETERGRLVVAE